MNAHEHYREAERLLAKAKAIGGPSADLLVVEAQLHATLATAPKHAVDDPDEIVEVELDPDCLGYFESSAGRKPRRWFR